MAEANLDGLVVSALPNVRYLSGFTGSNAALLATARDLTLFTDPRYTVQARQQTKGKVVIVKGGPLFPALMATVNRRKLPRLGFEQSRLSWQAYEQLREALPLGAELVPAPGLVEDLRMVKRPDEIELIRRSVHTNSQAFERALRRLKPAMSEMDFAAEIEYQMRRSGADKPAFDTIVASGTRTALPHASPSTASLAAGRLVLIDMGAMQDGYASDMTRMTCVGTPSRTARQRHAAVLEAQLAAIDTVRDGVKSAAVDRRARQVLAKHGLDKEFVHSTGHGLGLEIHEPPRLGRKDRTVLRAGMVITIEPGVYREGEGGVRIEDTVLVTTRGCEVLTPTPKELRVL